SGARYDKLMRDARLQAENYAKNLPASEPVAPFLIVCDIGRAFEIYHDAAGNGRGYAFFPDKQSYRIELTDLASERKLKGVDRTPLELLKAIWTDPRSIDPRFQSADVTRTVAKRLASVSQYIEEGLKQKLANLSAREKSEEIEEAALFLMRILFCMFAEDIGLLPKDKFKEFLLRAESNDKLFAAGLADLWQKMGAPNISPRFAHAVEDEVKYFNGGLFSETARTYPLGGFVIHDLYEAARQNWRKVEPAIFGTLLEQALTPEERAKLGAHYTPRPYVETLVRATIMDVLEPEWIEVEERIAAIHSSPGRGGGPAEPVEGAQASASPASEHQRTASTVGPLHHPADGPPPRAGEDLVLARAFHERLASIRVLDPACGTGNFLYVSMELMQALESRVIETIQVLGGNAEPKVGPHQFYGLEKNPRAAKIAELVLWIGWLRNRLHDDPDSVPQPVLAESANINFGRHGGYDAVLKMNALGEPDLENPMLPDWPEAEFIVGNPPFIGGKDLRERLGSDYAEALWKANGRVPKSADFVMLWWDRAAHTLVAQGSPLRRFGFVTTNSITQEFSRRVIAGYLKSSPERGGEPAMPVEGAQATASDTPDQLSPSSTVGPLHHPADGPPPRSGEDQGLSLAMAIPDHPWTKATKDSAAVRIAMTVAERGEHEGELREVVRE
ncbi:MAG TPA: DNA methyltransferase, partial [Sphingomicrobium sp.]|nr:DNA methyltransferase [Sphingomicrobium sp.]